MNIYANGFSTAIKNDGSEFVLMLLQEAPTFDQSGNVQNCKTELVGSYTLSVGCAKALAQNLFDTFLRPSGADE